MALSREQQMNARVIVEVGRSLGASQRDILIALMTAMQESSLRSGLTEARSDRDSAGLFQQRRPWAPNGSQAYRLNPYNAARMFFKGGHGGQPGLFSIRNRDSMSLTQVAQSVQRSAFPNAYARHENAARQLLGMGGGAAPAGGSSQLMRPIQGGRITQNFGDAPPPGVTYAGGRKNGMSIAAPSGTPIHAAGAGRVVAVGSAGAYGRRVEIEHGGRTWTLYAHMSAVNVRVGDTVQAGQMIGRVGATGQATGPHLHFEVRSGSNSYGAAIDPRGFLNMNTTPQAYIRDTAMEFTDVVEGQVDMSLLSQDMAGFGLDRPYVYIDPFAQYMTEGQVPGMMDWMGGLLNDPEQQFSFDVGDIKTEDEAIEPEGVL